MKKLCGILWLIAAVLIFSKISSPIPAYADDHSENYPNYVYCGSHDPTDLDVSRLNPGVDKSSFL